MGHAFAIILHLLAINIWIGGTFFSVVILPRAVASLGAPAQHQLMHILLKRFFFWVWVSMIILLSSGGWMIYSLFGGLMIVPRYVLVMMSIALLMMVVFLLIFFGPYRRYQKAWQVQNLTDCTQQLLQIRLLSRINMALGLCVVVAIGGGPFFLV